MGGRLAAEGHVQKWQKGQSSGLADVSNCHQKIYAQNLDNSELEQASADSKLVVAPTGELRNNA
jgi:hypothetical protein